MAGAFLIGFLTGLLPWATVHFYRRVRASQGVDGVPVPEPLPRGILRHPQPPTAPSADAPVISRMSLRSVPGRRRRPSGR